MRAWTAAGIVALLVAAAALGLRVAGPGALPAGDEPADGEGEVAQAGLRGRLGGGHVASVGQLLPEGAQALRRPRGPLTVRVTSAYEPRAGVTVRVRRTDSLYAHATAVTDDAGIARFAAQDRAHVVVEALAEGFRPTSTEREGFAEDGGVLELTLEAGAPVVGHVVEATSGRPVPGAGIVMRILESAYALDPTDAEGRFAIPGLPAGVEAEIVATVPGRVAGRAKIVGTDDKPVDLVLRLSPPDALAGRVTTADGAPVAGAEVVALPRAPPPSFSEGPPSPPTDGAAEEVREALRGRLPEPLDPNAPRGRSDATGAFRVDGVPADADLDVRAVVAGFTQSAPAFARVPASADAGRVTIVLRPAARVRVSLDLPPGEAPPHFEMEVGLRAGGITFMPEGGAEEGYLFRDVPAGPVVAVVEARGFRQAVARAFAAEGTELALRITLEPLGSVSGVVVDARGRPLAHAEVGRVVGEALARGAGPVGAPADVDGRFEFRRLEEPNVLLVARWVDPDRPYLVQRTKSLVRATAPAEVRLVLVPRGYVRVQVRVPRGLSAEVGRVSLFGPWEETPESHDGSPREGRFEWGDLADGEYRLTIAVPGAAWERRTITIENGVGVDLGEVFLDLGRAVRGRVVDSAGRPIAGVWVVPEELPSARDRGTSTDEEGRFALEHLPAHSPVRLGFAGPDGAWRMAEVGSEADDSLEIRLPRNAVLRGSVRAPAGTDLDGTPIVLRRLAAEIAADGTVGDPEEIVAVSVNEAGRFETSVRPGTWTALYTDRRGADHEIGSWKLAEGATVEVLLRLPGN